MAYLIIGLVALVVGWALNYDPLKVPRSSRQNMGRGVPKFNNFTGATPSKFSIKNGEPIQ